MIRYAINICLLAAFSLVLGAIWPGFAVAAQAPRLELLGQIKDGLRVPTRIDVDAAGNLYVADVRNLQVVIFDKYGQKIRALSVPEMSGNGLAVTPDGSRIYVAARTEVLIRDSAGSPLEVFGTGAGEFASVGFIDIDSDGNVYVADVGTGRIKVYSSTGIYQRLLGSVTFNNISSFAIDTQNDGDAINDEIYVADSLITGSEFPRLHVLSLSGSLLRNHQADGDFGSTPIRIFGGLAFDNAGRYYVADSEQNSLCVMELSDNFSLPGTHLLGFDNEGNLPKPKDMAFDVESQRLFALYGDRQILIFGIDGGTTPVRATNMAPSVPVPVSPIGGSEVISSTPALQFNNAVDPNTADEISYTVRVLDAAQQVVTTFNVSEQQNQTRAEITSALTENHSYNWQVQAFDGQEVSPWSDLQSFYVNAVEETPESPQLVEPLAGALVVSDASLRWQGADDSDPFDSVHYAVEVAGDAEFTHSIYSQILTATELPLVDWSDVLEPGRSYHWRVTAIDNHGLQAVSREDGRLSYQASLLAVTASMPGARVYLGGNQNYPGKYLGQTPLELRDLPEGHYQVVVERAGFEPYLQPVEISPDSRSDVYAQLRPAKVPKKLKFKKLRVAGKPINAGSLVTAQVSDLDLDGVEDLLLVAADGTIQLHPGQLQNELDLQSGKTARRQLAFAAGQPLQLPRQGGASLCLVDWNNDYRQDLLIGAADGSVQLFLNQGDFTFATTGQWLAAVNGSAVPAVADIDSDGDKDLVIGSSDGELVLLSNLGSDAQPQLSGAQLLVSFAEAAAPSFVDWDADGRRDLLIATEGQVYRAVYSDGALSSLSQIATRGANVARVQALDLDGGNGKDLVATTADGKLMLAMAKSKGKAYVEAFYPALNEKLLQLQRMIADENPVHLPLVDQMVASLAKKKLADVLVLAEELVFRLPSEAGAKILAGELVTTLKY